MEHGLGWRKSEDERNALYPMRALLGEPVERRVRSWTCPGPLDQGSEGSCVGFAWCYDLLAAPRMARMVDPGTQARRIYHQAKQIDEWPGDDYDGTSILAGAKVCQSQGWFSGYTWAQTVDDIIDALITQGPVILGTPWAQGMYQTLPNGLVKIEGDWVGGHAILLTGYHPHMRIAGEGKLEVVKWRNSWGYDYGRRGFGYVKVADLAYLMQHAEACLPFGRRTGWLA